MLQKIKNQIYYFGFSFFLSPNYFLKYRAINLIMRETKSPQKQQHATDPSSLRSFHNTMRSSVRMKPKPAKSDAEIIEQHYILHMIQLYNKNTNLYPNPTELISNLKDKEKNLAEIENQLKNWQGRKNQQSLKQQKKTEESISGSTYINFEEIMTNIVATEHIKFKLKFIPLFEKYINGTQQFRQLSAAQNEKIPEELFNCINFLIKTFQIQAKTTDDKWNDKFTKKIQSLEERNVRQEKQNSLLISKLNQNIKILEDEVRTKTHQKLLAQKQINQLQMLISLQKQTSNKNQEMVEAFEIEKKRSEQSEKRVSELLKNIDDQQNLIKEYIRYIGQLQQTNKLIQTEKELKQKQLRELKTKSQDKQEKQQKEEKSLSKVRSHQNFTSIRIIDQHENTEVQILKQEIKELKKSQIKLLKTMRQRQESEKKLLEKIINQWKDCCKNLIQQNDKQIRNRDELIVSLENQIHQLNKQIKLYKNLLIAQQPKMDSQP